MSFPPEYDSDAALKAALHGKPLPLVGRFFHTLDENGKIEWQGVVVGNPKSGVYLVQLFEWIMGQPDLMCLVRIEDMMKWLFYPDREAMLHSYEYGAAREGGPYRDPPPVPQPRLLRLKQVANRQ